MCIRDRFVKPTLVLFLILGAAVGAFSLYISPLSAEAGHVIEFKHRNRSDVTGIVPGVFTETRDGAGVYFVESYDAETDTFRNIFVYRAGEQDDVVVAATGYKTVDEKTNDDFLVLQHGSQYKGEAGDRHYTCLLYTSPSPRDATLSRMPSSA